MKVYNIVYDQVVTKTLDEAISKALESIGAPENTRPALLKTWGEYIIEVAIPTTRGLRIARRKIVPVELSDHKFKKWDYDVVDVMDNIYTNYNNNDEEEDSNDDDYEEDSDDYDYDEENSDDCDEEEE